MDHIQQINKKKWELPIKSWKILPNNAIFVKFLSFFGKNFIFKNDIAQKLYIIISKTKFFWKAKNA